MYVCMYICMYVFVLIAVTGKCCFYALKRTVRAF